MSQAKRRVVDPDLPSPLACFPRCPSLSARSSFYLKGIPQWATWDSPFSTVKVNSFVFFCWTTPYPAFFLGQYLEISFIPKAVSRIPCFTRGSVND